MGQLDKTRDNINVDSLNNTERKQLFNKMVKAGGQVIQEKPKKTIKIDRNKQREIQQRLDEHNRQNKQKQSTVSFARTSSETSSSVPQSDINYSGGFSILGLRFGLSFGGVTNFGGDFFKKKFLEKFKVEYNPALMELQMLYLDLFKQNPNQGWKIIENLDKLRPLYFELIEMSADVYDISLPARLLDNYTALPNERYRVVDYRDLITEYFKRLYIIHRYVDSLDFAFGKAIAFQQIVERGKSSVYSQKRKRAGNSIYIVFNKLFPKLHKLFCLIRGENIHLEDSRRFEEILGIKSEMMPGHRIPNQPSSLFSSEPVSSSAGEIPADDKTEKEDEAAELPEEVKNGLTLMGHADLDSIRAEVAADNLFKSVSQNDKVLLSYLLFREFDKEYSFILTTYKMKFSPAHSIRGKSDYRARLADVYNQMRSCFDALREYFVSFDVYEKARADRPTSQEQYFPYTKRLNDLDREKKAKGRASKNMLQNYMAKIIEETRLLMNDMDSRREIVLNPQDVLEFDAPVEMTLKMKGRKIHEAVRAAHEYASALYYRLSPGGDLYGEQVSDVVQAQDSVQKPSETPVKASAPVADNKPAESGEKAKDKSILGELDDLV